MNTNMDSLINDLSFEQELDNGSVNKNCEDFNGSAERTGVSGNEKLREILQNQKTERNYTKSARVSEESLNKAVVYSGAALIVCAFLPFVSVDLFFYSLEQSLIQMSGGWLILICGLVGLLGGLNKNKTAQILSGASAILVLLIVYYSFADGGYEVKRAVSQVFMRKEFGFYASWAAALCLTLTPFFISED